MFVSRILLSSIVSVLFSCYITTALASDHIYSKVSKLIQNENYQQALTELNSVDNIESKPELLKMQALSHLQLRQYDDAESLYLKIVKQGNSIEESNNLGLVYLRQMRLSDAANVFKNNIRHSPTFTAAYYNLGETYLLLAHLAYKQGIVTANEDITHLSERADKVADFFVKKNVRPIGEELKNQNISFKINTALKQELIDFIESWAVVRSDRNLELYIAHYAPGFTPEHIEDGEPQSKSFNAWSKGQALIFKQKDVINVTIGEPAIELLPSSQVSIVFDEWTGPKQMRDRTFKELNLSFTAQGWKITKEKTLFKY